MRDPKTPQRSGPEPEPELDERTPWEEAFDSEVDDMTVNGPDD